MKSHLKLLYDDCPEAYELRHVDDDSDGSSDQEVPDFFKANFELPPLSLDQEIGEFEELVLVLKKTWKIKKF